MLALSSLFWIIATLTSKVVVYVCTLIAMEDFSPCFTSSPTWAVVCIFHLSHSERCKKESQLILIWVFLMAEDADHLIRSHFIVILLLFFSVAVVLVVVFFSRDIIFTWGLSATLSLFLGYPSSVRYRFHLIKCDLSKVTHLLVTPTKLVPALSQPIVQARQTVDQWFHGWVDVWISLLIACRESIYAIDIWM